MPISKVLLTRLEDNPQANLVTTNRELFQEHVHDSSMYKQHNHTNIINTSSHRVDASEQMDERSMTFDEWLKRKEGEKRLKTKLKKEAKMEMKQQLAYLAQ
jgi:hypothetical protein